MRAPNDEQTNCVGSRFQVVEHVVRPGWNGPGLIRAMGCWDGKEQALRLAAGLEPSDRNAVAVRAYDTQTRTWADTGESAWAA